MKSFFTAVFCFFTVLSLTAQSYYNVSVKESRYRFSGESLEMPDEPNIGMHGIGYDIFGLVKKVPRLYFTINSYSAITGDRSGIFSFGSGIGYKQPLFDEFLSLDYGFFIGGGGGGGAPDGGGLITRFHFDVEKPISDLIALRLGVSRFDFPTGDIGSTNLTAGLVFNTLFYRAKSIDEPLEYSSYNNANRKVRVGFVYTMYNTFQKGPVSPGHSTYVQGSKIGLAGIQFDQFFTSNFYVSVEGNGAFKGGVDGYASYLLGVGWQQYLLGNLFADARVLGGPSGGGGIDIGGGASFQTEIGIGLTLFKEYEAKILAGKMFAPGGDFETQYFDFVVSKIIHLYRPNKDDKGRDNNYELEGYKTDRYSFSVFNRTYIPPRIRDKNGLLYDSHFNLIGLGVEKVISNWFSLRGSTVWAYQGSYGAYGEAWGGIKLNQLLFNKWYANAKLMAGVGGGGGIDVGSGLLFHYSAGVENRFSDDWSLVFDIGKLKPYKGNFTPWVINFGIKLNISQLVKS